MALEFSQPLAVDGGLPRQVDAPPSLLAADGVCG